MNIKHLSYVVEICRCGSINKAAQNLYISQSSLSSSVKSLEEELHYQLFRRKNSGIELTEEGKLFLESAKKILAEAEKIYRMLKMIEVTFVKYKDLTVLPYPLELLKEAARMDLNK